MCATVTELLQPSGTGTGSDRLQSIGSAARTTALAYGETQYAAALLQLVDSLATAKA